MSIDPNNLSQTAVLTFSEEFDGNALDLSRWNTAYPWSAANGGTNTANAEEQWYVRADYAPTAGLGVYEVRNGVLEINAMPTPRDQQQNVEGYDYVSGMINTHGTFSQTYGYFEMRADIPEGQGLWPAFWLLQDDLTWPPELDVMEVIGSSPDDVITSVHFEDGGNKLLNKVTTIPGVSDGMATFGMDWQPDEIVWYVDGVEVFRTATPEDMHDPMYLLANLAVGGTWPGSPTAESIPATLSIDYIRAYAERPEGTTPPAPVEPVVEEEPVVAETPAPAPVEPVVEEEEPVVAEMPAPAPVEPVEEEEPVVAETPAPAPVEPVEEEEPVVAETPVQVDRMSDWLDRLRGRDWFDDAGFGRGFGRRGEERIEASRDEDGDRFARSGTGGAVNERDGGDFVRTADRFAARNDGFEHFAERFGGFGRFERYDAGESNRDSASAADAFDFGFLDAPSLDDVAESVSYFLDVA